MANRILKDIEWEQRVRDKIGVDDSYLPDSALGQPDIIDVAEANIIEQVPNHADLKEDKILWLETATVCECAVLLCTGMDARLPKLSQGPHARYEVGADWGKKKEELQAERDNYLARIKPTPIHFHFGLSR